MTFDPAKHHRRSIRLKGYDYTRTGAYFVTIVAHNRQPFFGEILNGTIKNTKMGKILHREWERLPRRFKNIHLDKFVIMPNHIHAILIIDNPSLTGNPPSTTETLQSPELLPVSAISPARESSPLPSTQSKPRPTGPRPGSLGAIIGQFKSGVTKQIWALGGPIGKSHAPIWQRNYYEHIIRNDTELNHIRQYIIDNPLRWADDVENPARR